MDIDTRTLQRYKQLADMIPELSTLVDTGTVTKTTALCPSLVNLPDLEFYIIMLLIACDNFTVSFSKFI